MAQHRGTKAAIAIRRMSARVAGRLQDSFPQVEISDPPACLPVSGVFDSGNAAWRESAHPQAAVIVSAAAGHRLCCPGPLRLSA